jgi:hypothetical protein
MIAGIPLDISANQSFRINWRMRCFRTSKHQEADFKVSFVNDDITPLSDCVLMKDQGITWYYMYDTQNGYAVTINDLETHETIYQMQADSEWQDVRILQSYHKTEVYKTFKGPMGEILFRNRIIYHEGVVIHAAAIEWEGKGILFSAPSGTGKSTQAKLWKKFMGAKMINEDRPAIRLSDGIAYVYGTPWNGSSSKCRNCRFPLSAIVIIEQASENSMFELNCKEGTSELLPRCFLPYYDENLMKQAINNLEGVIAVTPIYLLRCKPDRSAVEMVYQCVK